MCKGLEYTKTILETYEQINNDFKIIKNRLSYLDKAQQDLLHMIENESFAAARGYCLAKQLKEIREERRNIKMECETMEMVIQLINNQKKALETIHNKVDNKYMELKRLQENKIYKNKVLNLTE